MSEPQNNMENKTEQELLEELNEDFTSTLLPVTVFVGVEIVVGFIGNLLILYVFIRHYHPCNFRTFVICLSFIDFLCTLTTMSGEMVTQRYWYIYPSVGICKTKDFFNVFTVFAESLCLLVISIDRYRKVCRPLKWQITSQTARLLCVILMLVSAVVAAPVTVFWGIRSFPKLYKNSNVTVTLCEKDQKYEDTDFPFGFEALVGCIVLVSLVIMFILYVFVARTIMVERRKWKNTALRSTLRYAGPEADSASHDDSTFIRTSTYNKTKKAEDETTRDAVTMEMSDVSGKNTTDTSTSNTLKTQTTDKPRKHGQQRSGARVRRKTLILFILTSCFIVTTVLYYTMISILGSSGDVVNALSDQRKVVFFFFLRFYFIQHIINPIVYSVLDPQVKTALRKIKQALVDKIRGR